MPGLQDFPNLTSSEFDKLCEHFITAEKDREYLGHGYGSQGGGGWQLKQWHDELTGKTASYLELVICRPKHNSGPEEPEERHGGSDDEMEEDPEALPVKPSQQHHIRLRYNILYSPTYRLPVLYWTADTPLTAEEIKAMFNPREGVVSQGEHPLNGEAWWFVHPCNTGEAMKAVAELVVGHEERYLSVWLGLVKNAAGLK